MDKEHIKKALVSLILRMAAEKTVLDSEAQEMLIKYHLGQVTPFQAEPTQTNFRNVLLVW